MQMENKDQRNKDLKVLYTYSFLMGGGMICLFILLTYISLTHSSEVSLDVKLISWMGEFLVLSFGIFLVYYGIYNYKKYKENGNVYAGTPPKENKDKDEN